MLRGNMVKNSVKSSVVSLLLDGLMKNCEEIITIKDLTLNYSFYKISLFILFNTIYYKILKNILFYFILL